MTNRPDEDRPVVEMDEGECWTLLEEEHVGRLGYHLLDEIHVVPVNYTVRDQTFVILSAAGNKLLAAELHEPVALEIDRFRTADAWSVLVRGRLERVPEDEAERLDIPPEASWVPTMKYDVVRVRPDVVTGRRFLLHRPDATP